jgi:hypothetical protein
MRSDSRATTTFPNAVRPEAALDVGAPGKGKVHSQNIPA